MQKYTVTFGGWYQRTTLHLTEIYDFLAYSTSRLKLLDKKIARYHSKLDIENVSREVGTLEYVKAKTHSGINIKYYEDGLYILRTRTDDIDSAKTFLSSYFENIFEPAINYIFSLGAPTPKVLANIKSHHPTVVSLKEEKADEFKVDKKYGDIYSRISSKEVTVYKTPGFIFVVSSSTKQHLDDLVDTQIFFREFKDQLKKYLNIHRNIWEEIAEIKEKGEIRGMDVSKLKSKLVSYEKTIDLIKNRINQMATYIGTRRSIAKETDVEDELVKLFQYKFETLSDTHAYIKELWAMTSNYLGSAIRMLTDIENQSTNISIRSLQVITTIGVVSGILGYLAKSELPKLNVFGVFYFVILLTLTWLINKFILKYYRRRKYTLRFTQRVENI
jgi:hypothetical protein